MYKELTHCASAPLIYLLSRKVTIVTDINSLCEFSAYTNDNSLSDATLTQERSSLGKSLRSFLGIPVRGCESRVFPHGRARISLNCSAHL